LVDIYGRKNTFNVDNEVKIVKWDWEVSVPTDRQTTFCVYGVAKVTSKSKMTVFMLDSQP
jgi:hypothetical protein